MNQNGEKLNKKIQKLNNFELKINMLFCKKLNNLVYILNIIDMILNNCFYFFYFLKF